MDMQGGPTSLSSMNKRIENLGGCRCYPSFANLLQHPTLDLSIYVSTANTDVEPVTLQVRDCMTVTQLKFLLAKKTGMNAEQQMLYCTSGGRTAVPLVGTKRLCDYNLSREDSIVVENGLLGGSFCICFVPCPPPCCKKHPDKEKRKDNYY